VPRPRRWGPGLTQGFFGYRDYDLTNTNCLVCWGTDPLASNRMVPNMMNQFPAIVKRGTVIAVDPRLSNVAAKAHEWLPISPGTDGALAGAIAHVLLTEGLWNKEFVGDFKDGKNQFVAGKPVDEAAFAEKETHGLVKWWNLELKDRTPAWGEKESLIPAAQIVRVARAMGKAAPKTIVWMGPGVAMTPRGTYAAMAVHALNGLLGSDRCGRRRVAKPQRPTSGCVSQGRRLCGRHCQEGQRRSRNSTAVVPRTCRP
jgi:anaerobic selenocysteine-containing dehydrogenase